MNKELQTADKGLLSRLGVVLTALHRKLSCVMHLLQIPQNEQVLWNDLAYENGNGLGSCHMVGFDISRLKPLGFTTT
jgi:hypothetical protein